MPIFNESDFLNVDFLAKELEGKLNGNELENVIGYGLGDVYPNTLYVFKTHSEMGEYLSSERIENTVYRYINGEVSLVDTSTEGVGESTYNAVVSVRAEFLIPLIGPERKNKALLSTIRRLLTETLKYTVNSDETFGNERYTHITDYEIATPGLRGQRDGVGDSVSLTLSVTHTFVALGISSNLIEMQIYNTFTKQFEPVAYSKLGIGRKSICDSNVFSDDTNKSTKNTPTSTVLTISASLLTRMRFFDYIVDKYTYSGELVPFTVRLVRPDIESVVKGLGSAAPKQTDYLMVFDTSGINAELDAISSTSVTLIETKALTA